MAQIVPIEEGSARRRSAPNSQEAEESVIGGVLVHPRFFGRVLESTSAEDFYHPALRAVFEAMTLLDRARKPIDVLTVVEQMRALDTFDKLRAFHGAEHLTMLMGRVVSVENVPYHAKIVRNKANARRLIDACSSIVAEAEQGIVDVDDIAERGIASISAVPALRKRPLTASERALQLGTTSERLPTGIPTLDRFTRGGLPMKHVIIVNGAPGAGKTGVVSQWAWQWARSTPLHVLFLAYDQGADPILVRVGQNEHFERDALEQSHHADHGQSIDLLAQALDRTPNYHCVDGIDEGWTIERASRYLLELGKGEPGILVVDSVQKAKTITNTEDVEERIGIKNVCEALKQVARSDGHLVVATSEVNRGAYKNRDHSQNSDELAAGSGSSSIEYAADLLLFMRSVKAEGAFVDVSVPKSRIGAPESFRLQITFSTAKFNEVGVPEESEEKSEEIDRAKVDAMRERIAAVVREAKTPITSQKLLRNLCRGKTVVFHQALHELLQEDKVVRKKEGYFVT